MQLSTKLCRFSPTGLIVTALLLTLIVAGCGNGGIGDSTSGAGSSGAASSLAGGVAHGAFGPIVGAIVIAYKAGTTGFGTGAVAITSAVTDKNGAFNFTSGTCKTGDAIYYISHGGNAGGGVNPAIVLMSEVGLCESLPNSVIINEVTTVSSVYALAQFIGQSNPYRVGTSATNVTGLKNAFGNVGNLVDVTTGRARSIALGGGTAPLANVNTIANALISCVNSGAGSAMCAELFECAKPGAVFDGGASCSGGSGTTPTDTLGATLNMALNPAQVSVAGIYDSSTIAPIFQPTLSSAPGTLILALNLNQALVFGFDLPWALAIDAAGSVWVSNLAGVDCRNLLPRVIKLAPDGAFITLVSKGCQPRSGVYLQDPMGLAIDSFNGVWITNNLFFGDNFSFPSIFEVNGGVFNNNSIPGAGFHDITSVAIDGANHLWVTNFDGPGDSVTQITLHGALLGNFNNGNTAGANFDGSFSAAIDAAGDAWVANLTGDSVTKLTSVGASLGNFNNTNTPGATFNGPWNLAIDAGGNAWATNHTGNSVTKLSPSGGLLGNFNNNNTPGAGFLSPRGIAIDAAGSAWITSFDGNRVTQLTSNGDLVGNFGNNTPGANFSNSIQVAIDSGGDVWVTNYGNNTLSELVGAARPVRTPKVACLKLSPPSAVCLP